MTAQHHDQVSEPFDWERHRAMSVKCLLDARAIGDDQAEQLKERLAEAVAEICPGQEGSVKASIAEEGSRRWEPVGDKVPVGMEPLFTRAELRPLRPVPDLRTGGKLDDD